MFNQLKAKGLNPSVIYVQYVAVFQDAAYFMKLNASQKNEVRQVSLKRWKYMHKHARKIKKIIHTLGIGMTWTWSHWETKPDRKREKKLKERKQNGGKRIIKKKKTQAQQTRHCESKHRNRDHEQLYIIITWLTNTQTCWQKSHPCSQRNPARILSVRAVKHMGFVLSVCGSKTGQLQAHADVK